MRDPIANDPFVQPDPVAGATTSTTGASTDTSSPTTASGVDSILSSLSNPIQIGSLSIPLWTLAAGLGLILVME
jgi:hypothetical protein